MKNIQAREIDHSDNPVNRRAVSDTRHKLMKDLQDVLNIQCSNGNWNHDPYMLGLANGLIMARALIKNEKPVFLNAPKKWLKDYPTIWTRIKWFFKKPNPTVATNEKIEYFK